MIKHIIDAISLAINGEFGDDYEIYTELVEQDIKNPCFFIACVGAGKTPELNKRYLLENQINIQYLTSSKEPNAELYDTYERLTECLELISINGVLTRATNSKVDIMDEILSFTTNYDFHVIEKIEDIKMEDIEMKANVRGWI